MIQQPLSASWVSDFGLADRAPPVFFNSKDGLSAIMPHAHVLRRAFDLLALDGVLCAENTPLVYFKLVESLGLDTIVPIQRQFWNHGGAPILVLVSGDKIHIYSAMSRPVPVPEHEIRDRPPSLVTELDRVAEGLQSFIVSVESGDFFRQYVRSFDPNQRIDRDLLRNLKDTRNVLDEITNGNISPEVLDALLCRVVFTCYLFDRQVIGEKYLSSIGIKNASRLRDVLSLKPVRNAKTALYEIFSHLQADFNGDLFSDDLEAEARKITQQHISTLRDFFEGTHVRSGQRTFWPYDFSAIPIETISAIYEHFLRVTNETGAFYTPRFLAEIVLDVALHQNGPLIGKTYLDPACGSGIFLVGLFNRMAEEWKFANPTARNNRRAKELMQLLTDSLFGVDINPTACRITAFSLYLAYLDQLTPRDIRDLQDKGRALPHLVSSNAPKRTPNIQCVDFFSPSLNLSTVPSVVIGNPPWGSIAGPETPAGRWCEENGKPLPDKQIATAFVWKAAQAVTEGGWDILLVIPKDRVSGPGSTPIMAAFTHLNPEGDRFTNGTYGVFYAGRTIETAIAETRYHRVRFMLATNEPAQEFDMRVYAVDLDAEMHDIRAMRESHAAYYRSSDYAVSQGLALQLRENGSNGIVYASVRDDGGECAAVFRPQLLSNCRQERHICYVWDGIAISTIYEKRDFG